VRKCRLCETPIEFWETPIEFWETPAGKHLPLERGAQAGLRVPHWANCPRADEFRQKSKQGDLFEKGQTAAGSKA
jgi:hypothetical protein